MSRRDDGLLYEMTLDTDAPPGEPYHIEDPFNDPVRPVGPAGQGNHHVAPMAYHFYTEYVAGLWDLDISEDDRITRASETIHNIEELVDDHGAHGGISMTRNGKRMVAYLDTVSTTRGPCFAATLAVHNVDITVGDYGLRLRAPHSVMLDISARKSLTSGDVFQTGINAFDRRPIIDAVMRKDHLMLLVDQPESRDAKEMIELAQIHFTQP